MSFCPCPAINSIYRLSVLQTPSYPEDGRPPFVIQNRPRPYPPGRGYGGRPGQGHGGYRPESGKSNINNNINSNQNTNQNENQDGSGIPGGPGIPQPRPNPGQNPGGNQNQDQNTNSNSNANNNVNNNQNQNTNNNANTNTNTIRNGNGDRPPILRDVAQEDENDDGYGYSDGYGRGLGPKEDAEVGTRQNSGGNDIDAIDDMEMDDEDAGVEKRSEEKTAKNGTGIRLEAKTCGVIIAIAMVMALV